MKSSNTVKIFVKLHRVLQVPDHLAEDPDQVHLGVHHLPPGQVVHAQLLVQLIKLLNVLPELERVTSQNLSLWEENNLNLKYFSVVSLTDNIPTDSEDLAMVSIRFREFLKGIVWSTDTGTHLYVWALCTC